ncbi:MAG: D-alanine--D-alanine ligase [Bacteroidetes bacterium]|jgi:D-alanine-D-alanine ligase|nr:D-alanine--D-alanine ligase [Bacteroidota bacterium]
MQRPRVGLCYDTFADFTWRAADPADADAEFEPRATVEALAAAVEACGFTPVDIGPARALQKHLCGGLTLDAAINIAESARSRNREAYVPILLEMAGIPCLGSDALTLSLSLDKAWTKDLVQHAGVPTPPYLSVADPADLQPDALPAPFPLFVKPRYEGTSKGITPESKVHTLDALRKAVARVVDRYRQPALVEAFVEGGGEFTVAVTGHAPPEALPALQRATEATTGIGLHALEHRGMPETAWRHDLEGTLHPALEATLQHQALTVFNKLECRDFARADFRVDRNGQAWFLEINPLPSFAPDDTFAIVAELMDTPYEAFLADVLRRGFERIGLG